jgi:hypothetical protein
MSGDNTNPNKNIYIYDEMTPLIHNNDNNDNNDKWQALYLYLAIINITIGYFLNSVSNKFPIFIGGSVSYCMGTIFGILYAFRLTYHNKIKVILVSVLWFLITLSNLISRIDNHN